MARRLPSPAQLANALVLAALKSVTRVLRALPSRWILWAADRLGDAVLLFDTRGRRVGRQNMRVMLGDDVDVETKRRIQRTAMRGTIRSLALTLHASPLTGDSVRRWVDIPEEVERLLSDTARRADGAVVVSGHIGNWEILLGLQSLFATSSPTTTLVEPSVMPAIDEFMAWLRGSSGAASRTRKGGAVALANHVRKGGIAALLVDRNTRRNQGGIWAPFFGLQACTTQLPAYLARRNRVPIAPLFCVPTRAGRYRLVLGPELAQDVRTDDAEADILEITTRINRVVEEVIRAHPETWNWTQKRFKSRPTRERGEYPSYSLWDPDRKELLRQRRQGAAKPGASA